MTLTTLKFKRISISLLTIVLFISCSNKLLIENASQKWEVQEYTIAKFRLIGPVGPAFDDYFVFDGKKQLDGNVYQLKDTCVFRFHAEKLLYKDLNICKNSVKELRPDKRKLDPSDIESIRIRPNEHYRIEYDEYFNNADTIWNIELDTSKYKRLKPEQIVIFTDFWNQGEPAIYSENQINSDYIFTVHLQNGQILRIMTGGKVMYLENGGWRYEHDKLGVRNVETGNLRQVEFDTWWMNN